MFKFLVLTTLLALGNAVKLPAIKNIRETVTTIDKVPHEVSLQKHKNGAKDYGICGGSIISNEWIVAAGQCIQDENNIDAYTVLAGTANREMGGSTHRVNRIIRHENFKKNQYNVFENDIALIKVEPPFLLDNNSRKIVPLYDKVQTIKDETLAVLSGWGGKKVSGTKPTFLHLAEVKIIGKDKCKNLILGTLSAEQICTESFKDDEYFSDRETGDSITVGGRLAGLVSRDAGSSDSKKPIIYTEIAPHSAWIKRTIKV